MENVNVTELFANLPYKRIASFAVIFLLIFLSMIPPKYNLFGKSLESKEERIYNKKLSRLTHYKLSGRTITALINLIFVLISLGIGLYIYNKSK
ncbi:Hypothetical transmembrane protein [Flavobacterium branchiophilum]|uniref:Hypothetical transmembrane protein n=1 Tax=Flavobacterium branchiophilum (strain FL-15) TaxID=1034807 RepID=G2Z5N2_FLABF|nr:hypothetical protein [Flavobacterium branchiophilum]CCB70830.1 Hypothetical transmembrane protein [Flavobacterium branchiophilum FL-15]